MSVPRTIMLPAGTFANGVPQASVIPVFENQIGGMYCDATNVNNATISTINSALIYTVPCGSVAQAYAFIQLIRNFLYSHGQGTFTPVIPDPLAWSSLTPSSGGVNNYTFNVAGTGFLSSGANAMKLDDGAGDVLYVRINTAYTTDVNFVLDGGPGAGIAITVPGTYTLYFSTNAGMSWTTTGLTFTCT